MIRSSRQEKIKGADSSNSKPGSNHYGNSSLGWGHSVCVCHCAWTLKHILSLNSHNHQMSWATISPFSRWEKATFGGCQHVFLKLCLLNGRIPMQMQVSTPGFSGHPSAVCFSPAPEGHKALSPGLSCKVNYWLWGHGGQGPFFPYLFPIFCSISEECGCSSSPLLASSWRAALSLVTLVISCFSAMFSSLQ